jgi:hypothetical protein
MHSSDFVVGRRGSGPHVRPPVAAAADQEGVGGGAGASGGEGGAEREEARGVDGGTRRDDEANLPGRNESDGRATRGARSYPRSGAATRGATSPSDSRGDEAGLPEGRQPGSG